jgi:hypothetical protein
MNSSCEHGNETSGFIKFWEILEWLSDWQILKKKLTISSMELVS